MVNVQEAAGPELDALVAKALGYVAMSSPSGSLNYYDDPERGSHVGRVSEWHPSTDWNQGGEIIEECAISTEKLNGIDTWLARVNKTLVGAYGSTPLVAAMRAFVISKLGEGVEL